MDVRHADAVAVGKRGERGDFADEPVDRQLPLGGVGDFLRARVERREGGERAHEHPHRVGVVMEPVHELLQVLVDERVFGDLLLGREFARDEKIGDLEVAALFGELLDGISPVLQYALVAVDERDGALACGGVHECGIIRHHPEIVVLHLDLAKIERFDRVVFYR